MTDEDSSPPSPSDSASRGPRRGGAKRERPLRVLRRPAPTGDQWEFVHSSCARRRQEDLQEVEAMLEAGETAIAREELVWLLSECPDFVEAHLHLGLLALEDGDAKLARGHFGRGVELGLRALEEAGNPHPLPYALPGNRSFFESAKGLLHCLMATGRKALARDMSRRVVAFDPADPLALSRMAGET